MQKINISSALECQLGLVLIADLHRNRHFLAPQKGAVQSEQYKRARLLYNNPCPAVSSARCSVKSFFIIKRSLALPHSLHPRPLVEFRNLLRYCTGWPESA